jgi:hypothetical protein
MSLRTKILWLGLVAFLAWATAAFYSLRLNPEVLFYRGLSEIQQAWADRLRTATATQFILVGGSSALFSVMPERAWEKDRVPLVNFGLAAGTGPQVMVLRGLGQARARDTLLVGIEPGLLTEDGAPAGLGIQYAFAMGHPKWICDPWLDIPAMSWGSAILALRPGAYHMVTLGGKLLMHRPLYRYGIQDVSQGGWIRTAKRDFDDNPPGHGPSLSAWSTRFLQSLARLAGEKGVRLMYVLPWAYCPLGQAEKFRQENAAFLLQISNFMPVLRDDRLGAIHDKDLFADSSWHLNLEGSRLRTDVLAAQLLEVRMWEKADLEQFAGRE